MLIRVSFVSYLTIVFGLFCFSAWEIMDVALETPDGRPDFQERKYCNYMTAAYENCTNIIRDCFPQEEINSG